MSPFFCTQTFCVFWKIICHSQMAHVHLFKKVLVVLGIVFWQFSKFLEDSGGFLTTSFTSWSLESLFHKVRHLLISYYFIMLGSELSYRLAHIAVYWPNKTLNSYIVVFYSQIGAYSSKIANFHWKSPKLVHFCEIFTINPQLWAW